MLKVQTRPNYQPYWALQSYYWRKGFHHGEAYRSRIVHTYQVSAIALSQFPNVVVFQAVFTLCTLQKVSYVVPWTSHVKNHTKVFTKGEDSTLLGVDCTIISK